MSHEKPSTRLANSPEAPARRQRRRRRSSQKNKSSRRRSRRAIARTPSPEDKQPPKATLLIRELFPMPEDEANQVSITCDDRHYYDIFSKFPSPLVIHPIDPNMLYQIDRDQRMRFLQYLVKKKAIIPGQSAVRRMFNEKEEDLATLMILSLSFRADCDDLRAELISLAPLKVLRRFRDDYCRPPFLHPGMLVKVVHVAARNNNIYRAGTRRYEGDDREFRKTNTVRVVVQIVALMLLSCYPRSKYKNPETIRKAIDGHVQNLRTLAEEPNMRDKGVQMGIIIQAVKELRRLLEKRNGRRSRCIVFGLRVGIGLMGMVTIGGPILAGMLPIIERTVEASTKKREEQLDTIMRNVKDICDRFVKGAARVAIDNGGDYVAFNDGLRDVETIFS